jgi:hypothetical protein
MDRLPQDIITSMVKNNVDSYDCRTFGSILCVSKAWYHNFLILRPRFVHVHTECTSQPMYIERPDVSNDDGHLKIGEYTKAKLFLGSYVKNMLWFQELKWMTSISGDLWISRVKDVISIDCSGSYRLCKCKIPQQYVDILREFEKERRDVLERRADECANKFEGSEPVNKEYIPMVRVENGYFCVNVIMDVAEIRNSKDRRERIDKLIVDRLTRRKNGEEPIHTEEEERLLEDYPPELDERYCEDLECRDGTALELRGNTAAYQGMEGRGWIIVCKQDIPDADLPDCTYRESGCKFVSHSQQQ